MRKRSLGLAGLFVIAAIAGACSEPSVATHIESTGKGIDTIPAGTTRTLTAFVANQNRDGMEGVDVVWTVLSGTGTISSNKTTTGGNGLASVTFTAPATSGEATVVSAGIVILGAASSFTTVVK